MMIMIVIMMITAAVHHSDRADIPAMTMITADTGEVPGIIITAMKAVHHAASADIQATITTIAGMMRTATIPTHQAGAVTTNIMQEGEKHPSPISNERQNHELQHR